MFIKPLVKYNKTTKQRYNIYQLCESFRLDGRVRHRIIIGFGKLDGLPDEHLRPIYHKTDDATMTHLHLGILAYCFVATIRYQLKQKGCKHEWREVVR